ncbi:hypothetical protein [Tessaracoccus coleopterorum]|nr:hypothetical protein [Tessaracoccus coleopterorum]
MQVGPLIGHVQLAADRAQAAFEPLPPTSTCRGSSPSGACSRTY